jgi:hypothetical protein
VVVALLADVDTHSVGAEDHPYLELGGAAVLGELGTAGGLVAGGGLYWKGDAHLAYESRERRIWTLGVELQAFAPRLHLGTPDRLDGA